MDIEINMPEEAQPKRSPQITGIGARLKAARESISLSEKDAANRLHLSPKFITIIESEDFENGPPATFMRGYIRSYARLLNFPDIEVVAILEQLGLNMPPSTTTVLKLHGQPLNSNYSDRYLRWISYVVVGVLLSLVGVWWATHTPESTNNTLTKNASQPIAPEVVTQPVTPPPAPTRLETNSPTQTPAGPVVNNSPQTVPAQPAAQTIPQRPAAPSNIQPPMETQNPAPNTIQQPQMAAQNPAPATTQPPVAAQNPAPAIPAPAQPAASVTPPAMDAAAPLGPMQQAAPIPQPSVVPPIPGAPSMGLPGMMPPAVTAEAAPTTDVTPTRKAKRHRTPTMQMAVPEPGLGLGDDIH